MALIEFLHGMLDVALVVLFSLIYLILRDIRDGVETLIAQNRLEAKRRAWVREEHEG